MRPLFLAAIVVAACSNISPTPRCTPGASAACACPSGDMGARVCGVTGESFGPCTCDPSQDFDAGLIDVSTLDSIAVDSGIGPGADVISGRDASEETGSVDVGLLPDTLARDAGDALVPLDSAALADAERVDAGGPRDVTPDLSAMDAVAVDVSRCSVEQVFCGGACVAPATDPLHCGGCDRACNLADTESACVSGRCVTGRCASNFGDCDGNVSNGCEENLLVSSSNCGRCGNSCPSGAVCRGGGCASDCGGPCPMNSICVGSTVSAPKSA